jgi:hypothetical protein
MGAHVALASIGSISRILAVDRSDVQDGRRIVRFGRMGSVHIRESVPTVAMAVSFVHMAPKSTE